MTGRSQVIAEPDGGHGRHVWSRSSAAVNTYSIRRGPDHIGRVALIDSLAPHDRLLDGFCRVLDEAEREAT